MENHQKKSTTTRNIVGAAILAVGLLFFFLSVHIVTGIPGGVRLITKENLSLSDTFVGAPDLITRYNNAERTSQQKKIENHKVFQFLLDKKMVRIEDGKAKDISSLHYDK